MDEPMNPHAKTLESERDELAIKYSTFRYDEPITGLNRIALDQMSGFKAGWNYCLSHLQKAASSGFNARAVESAGKKQIAARPCLDSQSISFLEGARYQYSQDVALIAARDERIKILTEALEKYRHMSSSLSTCEYTAKEAIGDQSGK